MRNLTQDNITQAVIARLADTPDARLKDIMTSLVQHLHAFAREVKLTEANGSSGIEFLTARRRHHRRQAAGVHPAVGHAGPVDAGRRHEQRQAAGCTEATVFGPFYVEGAPQLRARRRHRQRRAGDALLGARPRARPATASRWPVPQHRRLAGRRRRQVRRPARRARPGTQARGSLHRRRRGPATTSARSWRRPIRSPTTARWATCCGPTGRHPWRPAHLHFMITGAGLRDADHARVPRRRPLPRLRRRVRRAAVAGRRLAAAARWHLPRRVRLRPQRGAGPRASTTLAGPVTTRRVHDR